MIDWKKVKYFKSNEFDDPIFSSSGIDVDEDLVHNLDTLRERTSWAIITHWKVGGAIDVSRSHGHSKNSYHLLENGAKAVDFHFVDAHTFLPLTIEARFQYYKVEQMGFGGIGVYYCWRWGRKGNLLPIGFHVDVRPPNCCQRWVCKRKGEYSYLLGR